MRLVAALVLTALVMGEMEKKFRSFPFMPNAETLNELRELISAQSKANPFHPENEREKIEEVLTEVKDAPPVILSADHPICHCRRQLEIFDCACLTKRMKNRRLLSVPVATHLLRHLEKPARVAYWPPQGPGARIPYRLPAGPTFDQLYREHKEKEILERVG